MTDQPPHPRTDAEVADFARALGLPGILDIHVHFMPERMQVAVWRHFDNLSRPWPINYRVDDESRVKTLHDLGVRRYATLAYAHKPDMAAWLNDFTLAFAREHAAAIPSFTFFPEAEAEAYVAAALADGGRVAKVHLQVSKFDPLDPLLQGVWEQLGASRTPVVIHAGAVPDGSGGEEWCGMGPVRRLLERHSDLVLVLAHLGAPDYEDAVRLAIDFPQLRVDTAMTLVDGTGFTFPEALMRWLGDSPTRVLFGSDFPTIPHDYAAQVRGWRAAASVTTGSDGCCGTTRPSCWAWRPELLPVGMGVQPSPSHCQTSSQPLGSMPSNTCNDPRPGLLAGLGRSQSAREVCWRSSRLLMRSVRARRDSRRIRAWAWRRRCVSPSTSRGGTGAGLRFSSRATNTR